MEDPSNLTLVYADDEGWLYRQPAGDITEVGTLIHPDTGDDLTLVGYEVSNGRR